MPSNSSSNSRNNSSSTSGRPTASRQSRQRRQLQLHFRSWGGARKGAGRPPKAGHAGVSHLRRAAHAARHPLHVTLRVGHGVVALRTGAVFACVRAAVAAGQARFGFRVVHFSVQRDHIHLIAEASDRRALARGVQGLSVRVARAVNRQLGRSGRLFADRYHARALKTPREVRLALRYVLLNVRKHAAGRSGEAPAPRFVDRCSSAAWFDGFARPTALALGAEQCRADWARASGSDRPPVASARSWLLRQGLQRAGPFDVDDVPGTTGARC